MAERMTDQFAQSAPDGLVIVDKPAGWTSHDVVGRLRRLAHTKRVGHAGTLDPMATGVLVVGIGRATRLLGHLALTDKTYEATIRLGVATDTDDADGSPIAWIGVAALTDDAVAAALPALRGEIDQIPSSVSAIKVDGRRAYARVRAGEQVELAARRVLVDQLEVLSVSRARTQIDRSDVGVCDLDVRIVCSSGTYVRALARDLGVKLGMGGHLTRLRRTRVGPFELLAAQTLDQLAEDFVVRPLDEVAASVFVRRDIDAGAALGLVQGRPLPLTGLPDTVVAAFDPDGRLVALLRDGADGLARSLAVFAG
jgi:tRNA pseudouridine55 synthase